MISLFKKWPEGLRQKINNALASDGLVADNDDDAVNKLISAYHGYKNAYETVSSGKIYSQHQTTAGNDTPYYTPVFEYDGLHTDPRVIHNHDFMKDAKYIEACKAGFDALQHDHKMYWRLHTVLYFANRCLSLDGDFVECGVWKGFLSAAIAKYTNWRDVKKNFYLFDTFDGLLDDHLTEGERNNQQKVNHLNSYFKDCYEAAKNTFAPYPNIKLVKGPVPETLRSVEIEKVAYLSLDMNCVKPEIASAEYFWDRMVPSAPIILDDYGFVSYEEQKNAFNEFAKRRGVEVLHLPTGQGVILKP